MITPDVLLAEFSDYIAEHRRLEQEYDQIRAWPIVGFIKQMANIRRREQLNKAYEAKMKAWGIWPEQQ